MSRQGEENRQETKDNICLHCPAKTHGQQRENKTTPLCRFRTPTEDVFARQHKTVYLKTGTNGKLWQHKDVHGSVSSCSLSICECIQNLFPRMCATYLRTDFVSHWTLYNIVFHGMRFSAYRQLMSYLTRISTTIFRRREAPDPSPDPEPQQYFRRTMGDYSERNHVAPRTKPHGPDDALPIPLIFHRCSETSKNKP